LTPKKGKTVTDEPDKNSEDEFTEMLRQFLSGNSELDPSKLASAAGLPSDPAAVAALMQQLQNAMQSSGDGVDWKVALDAAQQIAVADAVAISPGQRSALEQALHVAHQRA
jgi:hypothetical protein